MSLKTQFSGAVGVGRHPVEEPLFIFSFSAWVAACDEKGLRAGEPGPRPCRSRDRTHHKVGAEKKKADEENPAAAPSMTSRRRA